LEIRKLDGLNVVRSKEVKGKYERTSSSHNLVFHAYNSSLDSV